MENKNNQTGRVKLIVDISAITAGYMARAADNAYTTGEILREAKAPETMLRVRALIEAGRLAVRDPRKQAKNAVINLARRTGDLQRLSKADISLVALAYDVKLAGQTPIVLTDDYTLQNICSRLGIKWKPVRTRGIKDVVNWILHCPACKRNFQPRIKAVECPVCGTKLKRIRR